MLIAVIGGKLQGVEAVYLAQKAGFQTLLIDKNPKAPAVGMCDQFLEFEFHSENHFPQYTYQIDLILPAIEDDSVLSFIESWSEVQGIPMAFDIDAYKVSSSKIKSNHLFKKLHLPTPASWPNSPFPVVVKPDHASGSQGVEIIYTSGELYHRFSGPVPAGVVVQEFLEGASFSVEVVGSPGNFLALQVTDLGMDENWDCNQISAPSRLTKNHIDRFKTMAVDIAEELELSGVMDLEAILHRNELKLLEIDARLPSQTPMAVFWSSGLNMVELLVYLFLNKEIHAEPVFEKPVLIEHIKVAGSTIAYPGEHIMATDGPLSLRTDFFGADEAVTSFDNDKTQWVATMIFTGISKKEIHAKRTACYEKILEHAQYAKKESIH